MLPPISPLFQQGGMFEQYNEDMTLVLLYLIMCWLLDVSLIKPRLSPKSRFFALHFVLNMCVVVAAAPDVYRAFTNPTTAFNGASQSMWANSAIVAIHFYHCLAFDLTASDIFHHLLFVTILCGLAIPFKQTGGVANNFGCFFLSGLPGGIDYLMLVLVKEGYMKKMTEKYWNKMINVWLRGPAMSVYSTLAWVSWWSGNAGTPNVVLLAVVLLHFFNGQYYAEMAVATYHRHEMMMIAAAAAPAAAAAAAATKKVESKSL